MSNFLGGLAAAYQGFQQGQDQELARQQLAKDRDQADKDRLFQQGQREFTQGQNARTLRSQTEDDALNDKLKGIALERDVEVSPATVGNNPSAAQPAVTKRVARTNDDLYAEYAKTMLAAGKPEKASQFQAASDQLKMKRHAGMFQELDGAWAGRSPGTPEETKSLMEDVKRIFNGDPMAGDIQDYSIGADGAVTVTALNKSTGQGSTKTMAPAQMMDYLRAYYSPESQAKLLADKRAHEYKVAEENNKVHAVGDGGMAIRNGKVIATNPKDFNPAGGRGDHFDAKQWDAAAKIPSHIVSLPSPMGDGKEVEDGNLRSAYMQVFNAAKAGGAMAPNEAAEHATTTMVKLKNAAAARVDKALAADKKSALTINQAVRDILKEASQFQPPQAQAPANTAAVPTKPGYANEPQMRASASSGMGADPAVIQREIKASLDGIKTVSDPQSKAALEAHVVDLQRQLSNIGGLPALAQPSSATAPTPIPLAASAQPAAPSHEKWIKAKELRNEIVGNANRMSPDRRQSYLASRLPEIDREIAFNQNYARY